MGCFDNQSPVEFISNSVGDGLPWDAHTGSIDFLLQAVSYGKICYETTANNMTSILPT